MVLGLEALNQSTPGSRSSPHTRSTPVPRSPNQGATDDLFKEFQASPSSLDSRSYDKIRQSFKYPRFSGQAK
jgi:hypothetical protein